MSVSLSAGMRTALYSMGDIQGQIDTSNKRLATGRKVNDAIDNARAYFQAQGFQKDSRDLGGLLDSMNLGLSTVEKATKSFDSMRKLAESAQALGRTARGLPNTDAAGRDAYGAQIAELMQQMSRVAQDAGYNGRNLLQTDGTAPAALDIVTNLGTTAAAQTKITLTFTDVRMANAAGLGASAVAAADKTLTSAANGLQAATVAGSAETVTYAAGNFTGAAGDTKLDSFINFATSALSQISAKAATFATQATSIQIRQDFTKSWSRTLSQSSDQLVLADINEEGANLSALQTKQQLSVQALSLASRADQAILRLF
jgi:flagellin